MTIKSLVFTPEQVAHHTHRTEQERKMRTEPATRAQIRYIMALIWNKGGAFYKLHLPASGKMDIPTARDFEQYNKLLASDTIDKLQDLEQARYGLHSLRKIVAMEEYGWAEYLGDISDVTEDITFTQ